MSAGVPLLIPARAWQGEAMFGSTGILIALIVVTIVLAAVFLMRSSITVGATGKILAFVGLCALPALCIGTGMSFQNQRSKQTRFCIRATNCRGKVSTC